MALVLLPFFSAANFSTPSQREYTAARYSSFLHPLVGAASNPEANWSASWEVPPISSLSPPRTLPAPRNVKGSGVKSLFNVLLEG